MAIKLKKKKVLISFGAFFLSVSLLFAGTALVARCISASDDWQESGFSGLFCEDYQNTGRFRRYMQQMLSDFLAMASGGAVGNSVAMGDAYRSWNIDTGAVLEQTYTEAEENQASDASDNAALYHSGSRSAKEQNEADAKAYHEALQKNKSLRYRIVNGGRQLYTNMDDLNWDTDSTKLPEGYNFLLKFNGEKTVIVKDGRKLDIYGDGYYRGSSQWYVPGYRNFAADEKFRQAEITILAAETPVYYSYAGYGDDGGLYMDNRLYEIAGDVKKNLAGMRLGTAMLAAGLMLFLVYLYFRKEKRAADEIIGRFTGKIWLEGKAALLLLLAAALRGWLGESFYLTAVYGMPAAEIEELGIAGWAEGDEWLLGQFYFSTAWFAENPVWLLIVFWTLYLLVNDVRRNRGHFWDGFIRRFVQKIRTDSLKQPFGVRAVRRAAVQAGAGVASFGLVSVVMAFYAQGVLNGIETFLTLCLLSALYLAQVYYFLAREKRQAQQLELLAEAVHSIQNGDFTAGETPQGDSDLKPLFHSLSRIRQGMETAVGEQLKSERMKVELVANVSHDLKTPLTSIVSYIDFLKQEEELPEHVRDYIRILDEKAGRLHNIVQDVFAVSKAVSGQLPVELEKLDFAKLLRQTLADMQEQTAGAAVQLITEIPKEPVFITADGSRLYRVFQNLIQNALKYSLEGSRIFVELTAEGDQAWACVKNISRVKLRAGTDFTQRFMRGDESRTDGGAGLGLSIAKSFTQACGGEFALETNADLFIVKIGFAVCRDQEAEKNCQKP